jgi:pimeloyl-ACP methyl ester carboxylesterase
VYGKSQIFHDFALNYAPPNRSKPHDFYGTNSQPHSVKPGDERKATCCLETDLRSPGLNGCSWCAVARQHGAGSGAKPDDKGFIKLTKTGVYDDFAQDVTPAEKELLFTAQSPTSVKSLGGNLSLAAWHDKPSWYIVAANDRAIQPALEAQMAKTIKAKTTTVKGSHMIMLSKAPGVAAVIEEAATR